MKKLFRLRTLAETTAIQPCLQWREIVALHPEDRTHCDEKAFQQHITGCTACRATAHMYQLSDQALQRLPLQRPPHKVRERLEQRLEMEQFLNREPPVFSQQTATHLPFLRTFRVTSLQLLLHALIGTEPAHFPLIASAIGISERRLKHWLHGVSEPNLQQVSQILDVLSEPLPIFQELLRREGYGGELPPLFPRWEIPQSIYRLMLEKIARHSQKEENYIQQIITLFQFAVPHLDLAQHGIALTYAQCTPSRDQSIRSLFIVRRDGQFPWKRAIDQNVFLGLETLAGQSVFWRRPLVWKVSEGYQRGFPSWDDYEQSAYAVPVQRSHGIAGILLCSSTNAGFFDGHHACDLVEEYARLLGYCIPESYFFSAHAISLEEMPSLNQQRRVLPPLFKEQKEKGQLDNVCSSVVAERRIRSEIESILLSSQGKQNAQRKRIESA